MIPDELIRIQIRCIAGKKMRFQGPLEGLNVGGHHPCFMSGQPVHHQEDRPPSGTQKHFPEFDEPGCIQASGVDRIPKGSPRGYRGNSADRLPLAADGDDRRLSPEAPGSLQRSIRTNAGLVQKEKVRTPAFGALFQARILLGLPSFDRFRVPFIRTTERFLRRNLQLRQQTSNRGKAQRLLELPLDQLGDDSTRPQPEVETVLTRVLTAYPAANLLFLSLRQLGRWAGMSPRFQGRFASCLGGTKPTVNTGAAQTVTVHHRTGGFALTHPANGHHPNGFQRLVTMSSSIHLHGRKDTMIEWKCVA